MTPEIDHRPRESFDKDSEVFSIRLSGQALDELKDWLHKQPGAAGECRKAAEKHLPSLTIETSPSVNDSHGNRTGDNQSQPGVNSYNPGDRNAPAAVSGTTPTEINPPAGSNTNTTEINTPAGSNTNTTEINPPAGSNTNPTEINTSAGSNTNTTEINTPAGSNTNTTEINPPAGSNTNPAEVNPPAGSNTNPAEVNPPAGSNTNPADVNPPASTNPSGAAGVDSTTVGSDALPPQAPVEATAQTINASGVKQGPAVGDCYFLAALASVANTPNGPSEISNMITNNADGSHTVRFPGAANLSINVTDADIKNDGLQNNAQWANVIEAAFLKYQRGTSVQSLIPLDEGINDLGNCQTSADALQLLTGQNATRDSNTFVGLGDQRITFGQTSAADLQHDLETSLHNGDAVTAEVGPNWPILTNNGGPLVDDHVYSVLGYNTQTDTVTVRNPWGDAVDTALSTPGTTVDGITSGNDGDLTMSFATFQSHFDTVNLANQNDLATHAAHIADDQIRLAQGAPNIASQVSDFGSQLNETAYLATSTAWNLIDSGIQASAREYGWADV